MADVNNKLRLDIVTQLDAAGIKATKDQIDQLELGLRRAGKSSQESGQKFGQLEKALGNLPGPLGRIGGALGGVLGQIGMVAGAFTTGLELGNKVCDKVLKPLGLIPDAQKEIIAENRRYARELAALADQINDTAAAEQRRMTDSAAAADKAIKKIDDQTAAYFRQAAALEGLRKSQGSAEMLQLERAKFEEMRSYAESGNSESAEQIGRYYDVLIAELDAKRQLDQFDRESVKVTRELAAAQDAYKTASEGATKAKEDQVDAEVELANHRSLRGVGGMAVYDNEKDARIDDMLEKRAIAAKAYAEKAAETLAKRGARLENVDAEMLQRKLDRANLAASGSMAVDRAAAAYDDYVAASGNPLNAQVDPKWAQDLLAKSAEADQTQRDILAEVKNFGDRLERLLEVK